MGLRGAAARASLQPPFAGERHAERTSAAATGSALSAHLPALLAPPCRNDSKITKPTPPNSATSADRSKRMSLRDRPTEIPKMGVIKGETSMAPITTAGLFASKPKVAITTEEPSRT